MSGSKCAEKQGNREECNLFRKLEVIYGIVCCMSARSWDWKALEWNAEVAPTFLK